MTDEELQAKLLAEVPSPDGTYWDQIDDLLNTAATARDDNPNLPASTEAAAGADTGHEVADITIAPASDQLELRRSLRRRLRWPAAAAAAALLVLGGWFLGNRASDESGVELAAQPGALLAEPEGDSPRANLDHWNSVYAVWDCTADDGAGAWLPPFQSTVDDYGIHSHGDGLISIHPFSEVSAGAKAQFGLFAESMGIEVTADAITLDDGRRLEGGTDCGGEPAAVQLLRWQYDFLAKADPRPEPTVITGDFNDERFFNDREVWVLAFAPLTADLPQLPIERYEALDRRTQPVNPMEARGMPPRWRTPPPADIYLAATPGFGDDQLATQLFDIRTQQNAEAPGGISYNFEPVSVRHISSVQSARRTIDIFQTELAFEGVGRDCTTAFSSSLSIPGVWLRCQQNGEVADVSVPTLHTARSSTLTSVLTTAAPGEARWLVIETDEGLRVVTDVFEGIAYAEWSEAEPGTFLVTLLDQDMELIFTFEDS